MPPARFPGLPEPKISEDGEYDDHDPDDVEHVHALLLDASLDSTRREATRVLDLSAIGTFPP